MKILLTLMLFVYLAVLTIPLRAQNSSTTYVCPMHPEVTSSKPGNCPKCGMRLVKKESKTSKPVVPKKEIQKPVTTPKKELSDLGDYTCIMHPEVIRSKPGNCPVCGMKLVLKTKTSDSLSFAKPTKNKIVETDSIPENKEVEKKEIPKAGHKIEKPGLTFTPKAVRYDLYLKDTIVTFGEKRKHAIAINGSIPAPTLTFTEGDTAEVYVHNMLKEETSIHWHGIFLPNQFDGVPWLTQKPIKPGKTHLYKFPIIQNGTYWYHSHTKLQEQIGMYGALILLKRAEPEIPAIPVVISDWTNMKPREVQRSLHNATDWFAIKKGSTQDYLDAIKHGEFKTKITNEWKRMLAMDVSDVHYDAFLINGKKNFEMPALKAGDKVKLRVINAGAATYFWLTYSGGKITVVGNDGNDVEPVEVDRLIVGVAETYDVIVTVPENMSYEFVATSEDRIGQASLWLGSGLKQLEEPLPKLKYFAGMKMMNDMMKVNGNMDTTTMKMKMANQVMDMNTVMYPEVTGKEMNRKEKKKAKKLQAEGHEMDMDMTINDDLVTLNYTMLKSPEATTLPKGNIKELFFTLTGNMNRFVWSINDKTVSESDKILIKKGEIVRIIMFNNTMMRHPMHLHGHDFRLLNGQGDYDPLKNTVDIMPMEVDTLEFAASESGDWFFHCHFLYHMMSGMGRVFSYENSPPNPELPNPASAFRMLKKDDKMWHQMFMTSLENNGAEGEYMVQNRKNALELGWHLGINKHHGWELEANYVRFLDKKQFLSIYAGADITFKEHYEEKRFINYHPKVGVIGLRYVMPLLIVADVRVDNWGRPRLQLSRHDIPLTKRLRFDWMFNTDLEYMVRLRYIIHKYVSVTTHYDSDMMWGAGIAITY
jgi:CopA family copper-resistance protein